MSIIKPPVLPPWADSGDKVQPSNAELQVGWPLSSTPPSRQRFNWILNYLANAARYFSRRGIPDYDVAETYMIGDRIIGDDGKTYRSLQDNNTAHTPSSATTWWEEWAPTLSRFAALIQGQTYTAFTTAGTAPNFTLTPSPAIAAYAAGQRFRVKFHAAGAGADQLNVSALGNKALKQYDNTGSKVAAVVAANQLVDIEYDGVDMVMLDPLPPLTTALQAGEVTVFATNTVPSGYLKANGAAISRATYSGLFAALIKSATVTISIASPGVVTWNNHGRSANDPVKFTTTGALPTGLTAGTTYYVVGSSIATNTFQVSATAGGAAINTSGAQSGVHTAIHAPSGDGDGSTTFNVPDLRGEFIRGWDDSRAVDASRAFGSAQAADIAPHAHSMPWRASGSLYGGTGSSFTAVENSAGGSTNNSTGTETRPRNVALMACIKY